MATTEQLLELEGVGAAGEFTADGDLVDWKASLDVSPEMDEHIIEFAPEVAKWCAAVTAKLETAAQELARATQMSWLPQRGWTFTGGDWTVAVWGNRGVFVRTVEADFNRVFEALSGK